MVGVSGLSPCDGNCAGGCCLRVSSLGLATLGGWGRKWVLAAPTSARGLAREGTQTALPTRQLGCLLTNKTVMILNQFGQKDFKLRRGLTCIPVTFDMLILWK